MNKIYIRVRKLVQPGALISSLVNYCQTVNTMILSTINQIANGPTYKFILKAFSKRPAIEFSFNRYDFGLCYIQDSNAVSYHTELRVTNSDEIPFV